MRRLVTRIAVLCALSLTFLGVLMVIVGATIPAHLIVYVASDGLVLDREVFVMHLERHLSLSVTQQRVADRSPLVSPDGNWLIYRPNANSSAFSLLDLNTLQTRVLPEMPAPLASTPPTFLENPDGIYFVLYGDTYMVEARFLYDIASDDMRQLDDDTDLASIGSMQRYYQILAPGMGILNDDGEFIMITLDADGLPRFYDENSDVPPVEIDLYTDDFASLSPNLEWFALPLTRDGRTDLYLVPAWEGEPIRLTDDDDSESGVTWSPDSRYVAYLSSSGARREFRVMDIQSGEIMYRFPRSALGDFVSWIE